ncbi:MAG: biotin/lipoyl-containing protein, partial [Pseudomonadota bacterium]|nr:biotin/lipoyl-containing protein [Pseudomonadota bacterium]
GVKLASDEIDDVLTYALFPQIGLKFLQNRGDASAFEPAPTLEDAALAAAPKAAPSEGPAVYTVNVSGQSFVVQVSEGGDVSNIQPVSAPQASTPAASPAPTSGGEDVPAPLAGNIFKVLVSPGQQVAEGETVMIMEAMKMETEISAPKAGTVASVYVKEGDAVQVGQALLAL